jgi:arginase
MQVDILRVPYDSGQHLQRMGRGPDRLLESGLAQSIASQGHTANLIDVELETGFTTEVTAAASIAARLSTAVTAARNASRFPLVLSGNCASSLGTVSGLRGRVGVVWFDAHADFNTPESTRSGFFDGQALSALTGRCWSGVTSTIPAFEPVPDPQVVLVGARDLDDGERDLLSLSCVKRVDSSLAGLGDALKQLAVRVDSLYLHIDLDVLDAAEVRVNQYSVPNGLSSDRLVQAIERIGTTLGIHAAALTAYDPSFDPDGAVGGVTQRLVQTILLAAK